jgi:hypothetical protein
MPPVLQNIIDNVDPTEIQKAIDELRAQLQACEDLLTAVTRFGLDADGKLVVSGGERVSAARKREMVLSVMGERPGTWSTREVREALAEHGIDPDAGTPVKNILWQLGREGQVSAAGSGIYELSALTRSTEPDQAEVLAA